MKKLMTFLAVAFAIVSMPTMSLAAPWDIRQQNIKLPTQAVLEHAKRVLPLGSSVTYFKSGQAISNSVANTITSFSNSGSADFARNVTLTPTGTTANVAAGTAVVSGLGIAGKVISENFSIASAQNTATTGSKAFKSINSVTFPIASGTGVTLSIGLGGKFGISHCMNNAGDYVFSEFGGVYDATRGTMSVSSTDSSLNTFTPNSSPDGAHDIDLFYVQNFRCFGN